jgi:hypothetical protein
MSMDIINWEILADGTISLKTPGISKENHVSADDLLDQLAENMGGAMTIEKLKKGYVPVEQHSHGHVHH